MKERVKYVDKTFPDNSVYKFRYNKHKLTKAKRMARNQGKTLGKVIKDYLDSFIGHSPTP